MSYNSRIDAGVPVILRATPDGNIIALLPTIPVRGLDSSIVAYSEELGWFQSDIGIFHSTVSADKVNTWPILAALVQKENIRPIRIVKKVTQEMTDIRLNADNAEYSARA